MYSCSLTPDQLLPLLRTPFIFPLSHSLSLGSPMNRTQDKGNSLFENVISGNRSIGWESEEEGGKGLWRMSDQVGHCDR